MSFRLRKNEAIAHGFVRLVGNQIEAASEHLASQRRITDERIHEARKSIKRARAALRLFRDAIPQTAFTRYNLALRDAARPLTEVRDAKVLLDTLASVREYFAEAANCITVDPLQRELRAQRLRARRTIGASSASLASARRTLRNALQGIEKTRVRGQGWDVFGPAVRRIYRRARRGLEEACNDRSDEQLHEWRKRVKHLWHALQILEPLRPALLGELRDQSHKLADLLGDDHDLATLARRASEVDGAERKDTEALLALIATRRQMLQERALAIGERLFLDKPSRFEQRLRKYWHRWQREGRSGAGARAAMA